MKILVGLGNPGDRYARNRHNIGFMAVDAIAQRHRLGPWKKKFAGLAADGEIAGERVLLLKPDTYMNESGRAVGEACRFLKVGLGDVTAFHDELDLDPGKLKIKLGGGNAGHNGLRSITALVGNEYWRVRLGIGHPGSKDLVSHFVLSDFAKADKAWLEPLLAAIAEEAAALAAGQDAKFVMGVQRRLAPAPAAKATTAASEPTPSPHPQPASSGARHPAGERANKRQSAIAENLRKWLAGRGSGGKGE